MDWTLAVVVGIAAAALNNVLHTVPRGRRPVVVNLGVAVGGVAAAAWLVLRGDPAAGLLAGVIWAGAAAAVVAVVAVVAERVPRVAAALGDPRMGELPPRAFALHVGLRIPLLSALAEEVIFRGVVWGLLAHAGGTGAALAGSTIAFAASHVAVGVEQAERSGRPVSRWVLITLASTGAAGVALGLLRATTGGIWASAGVHAVVNVGLALVARRHARPARADGAGPGG